LVPARSTSHRSLTLPPKYLIGVAANYLTTPRGTGGGSLIRTPEPSAIIRHSLYLTCSSAEGNLVSVRVRPSATIAEIATGGQKSELSCNFAAKSQTGAWQPPHARECRHAVETALTVALNNSIFLRRRCKDAFQHPRKSGFQVLAPKPVHNDRSLRL
jgi:hypothetical protein